MKVENLLKIIGSDFYCGVPDSQLKPLCDYLMLKYGINSKHHLIAANEGNCVAIAAGYHLATGKIPVVYLQNSGEGNIINPVASLLNDKVYAIPMVFIIGWRGEPGVHDEPQHIYQGQITVKLLEDMEIKSFIVSSETSVDELREVMAEYRLLLDKGKNVAFIIKKGALTADAAIAYKNDNGICREDAIKHIVDVSGDDPIVSTTGKISRELFELREANGQSHKYDFLTVGSMGHSSSIALGVALNKPKTRVWCIDGDGAAIMHMGAMAVIGSTSPPNMIHIVLNNGAHESVGGMPTVANDIGFASVAKACGYKSAVCVDTLDKLDAELTAAKKRNSLSFIEVKCAIGSRADLGRPTTSAAENKSSFMNYMKMLK